MVGISADMTFKSKRLIKITSSYSNHRGYAIKFDIQTLFDIRLLFLNRMIGHKIGFCLRNLGSLLNLRSLLVEASNKSIIKMSTGVPLDTIPKVDIDNSGIFKYILIKVYDKKKEEDTPLIIVRGYKHCNYHSDIYDEVQEKLYPLECEVLGGGRISHDSDFKRIKIYGYSQGFGKADHEVTANIIKNTYPKYTITISDEGY